MSWATVRATWPRQADWMTRTAILVVRYWERAFSMRMLLWMMMAARRRRARRASALASMPLAPAWQFEHHDQCQLTVSVASAHDCYLGAMHYNARCPTGTCSV